MNYPEEIREKYNECMYDERNIIEKFLKDQYDIRYGRQRDTWHFEPAVKMLSRYGNIEYVTHISLDEGRFVIFFLEDGREYECFDFAYGELSKVIEALPDVNQILIKNAVSDIASLCRECSVNLEENPFNTKINGKHTSIALVDYIDGRVVAYNHDGKVVSDEYACDFLVGLRDHINIEVLHRSNEYKELMEMLSLEENMRFECQNYGDATFVIDGTDVTFDVLSVRRNDNGGLVIYGNDIDADVYDNIELTEKDIKHEYLVGIINEMKRNKYSDIMNTYNGHNEELVRKINTAWKNSVYRHRFAFVVYSIAQRDYSECEEKFNCDMGNFLASIIDDCDFESIHNVLQEICDDIDLQTILLFIRYK